MFGLFNIEKILVLAIILVIVWHGFKLLGRAEEARRAARKGGTVAAEGKAAKRSVITPVEDMIKCPTCGDYVPKLQATACQKPRCPY